MALGTDHWFSGRDRVYLRIEQSFLIFKVHVSTRIRQDGARACADFYRPPGAIFLAS
jgi:hypothetical protein